MAQISKDVLAAAAAHGLSAQVVETWHPDLPRTPRVLVPIQLDALAVREDGRTFADCHMRPPTNADPDPIAGGALLPAPFTDEATPRARGVYLHWALPDALGHGVASDDGASVAFPAIPDRWLVLRLSPGSSTSRRAVRGWVIEGGNAEPRVTDLDAWQEPGATPPDDNGTLTALGHGDPAWSAYFANVVGRLGFFDNLSDVPRGPLAYLVCGWHSRTSDDPIGEGLSSLDAFQQRLHALGWELAPGDLEAAMAEAQRNVATATLVGLDTREARFAASATSTAGAASAQLRRAVSGGGITPAGEVPGSQAPVDHTGLPDLGRYLAPGIWWPQHTLYHGGVVGLGWPSLGIPVAPNGLLGGEVGGPPDAAGVQVSVGNTMTEALAALVAHHNGSADGRLLEAALLGLTNELDEPDGSARLDVRLHAAGFGSLSSGSTTEIIPQRPLSPPPRPHVPDPSKTDPGVFRGQGVTRDTVAQPLGKGLSDTPLGVPSGSTAPLRAQALHIAGGLLESIATLDPTPDDSGSSGGDDNGAAFDAPSVDTEVSRTLPRRFIPPDPVILVEGAKRSFKHGGDGMFSETGRLVCRISGHTVTMIAPLVATEALGDASVSGDDLIERGAANGGVPLECESLLREIALLDPGSADVAVRAVVRGATRLATAQVTQHAATFAVEQMAWWVGRDPKRDMAPLAAASGITGVLPSPIAISPPATPWVPLHLDWEAEYIRSSGGVADWQLEEVDFDARPDAIPSPDANLVGQLIRGRALLNAGAARVAADAVRRTIEQAERSGGSVRLSPGLTTRFYTARAQSLLATLNTLQVGSFSAEAPPNDLSHLADELDRLDALSGALDGFHTSLRGGLLGDGVEAPPLGQSVPDPFVGVRAGYLRFRRLRLVDCFGQVLYLAGSSVEGGADTSRVVRSEPLTVESRPDLIELAPRFTSPARLTFRFTDANDDTEDATGDGSRSPLCGFLLPNHLDGDLQFHAPDGVSIGAVRPQAGVGIVWEDSPGVPTTLGKSPLRAISNRHVAELAQALLDWGVADITPDEEGAETALSALLRIIDSTLWSVDPFGHVGDEHLALLVAHPIAVMRARIRLEVQEPVDDAEVKGARVPVRIGALAHWEDGLLGYFVNDDYRTLYVPDPSCAKLARPIGPHEGFLQQASATSSYYEQFAADIGVTAEDGATPVDHPYVDPTGVLLVQPNQDVRLTLLMEPHSVVHATTGLLPRKDIGMRREWVAAGLSKLAPVFRFGPVLVDPKRIRMPVASDIRGTWSWSHRVDPMTWADDPVVTATGDAALPQDPSEAQEGWLKLTPPDDTAGAPV